MKAKIAPTIFPILGITPLLVVAVCIDISLSRISVTYGVAVTPIARFATIATRPRTPLLSSHIVGQPVA
jgi:hypothetical protein